MRGDAAGVGAADGAGEDGLLDRVDVGLHARRAVHVRVDDPVVDRVRDRPGALAQQLRLGLQVGADLAEPGSGAPCRTVITKCSPMNIITDAGLDDLGVLGELGVLDVAGGADGGEQSCRRSDRSWAAGCGSSRPRPPARAGRTTLAISPSSAAFGLVQAEPDERVAVAAAGGVQRVGVVPVAGLALAVDVERRSRRSRCPRWWSARVPGLVVAVGDAEHPGHGGEGAGEAPLVTLLSHGVPPVGTVLTCEKRSATECGALPNATDGALAFRTAVGLAPGGPITGGGGACSAHPVPLGGGGHAVGRIIRREDFDSSSSYGVTRAYCQINDSSSRLTWASIRTTPPRCQPSCTARDRLRQPADALVDLVGSDRRERQPQRVLAALEQEVAALDDGHAPAGRLRQQLVDVDVLGQVDPEEVAAVRLGELHARDVLAQRLGQQRGPLAQRRATPSRSSARCRRRRRTGTRSPRDTMLGEM